MRTVLLELKTSRIVLDGHWKCFEVPTGQNPPPPPICYCGHFRFVQKTLLERLVLVVAANLRLTGDEG